jgi:hypothetical protein
MSHLLLIRDNHNLTTTIGKLYTNKEFFSHTLEDVVRGHGIKIPSHTALPEGTYKWVVSKSRRFQRDMIMIYTEDNQYEVRKNGIKFKGIRMHGGNTHHNSEGCVLVAKNLIDNYTIQGTMEGQLTAWAKEQGGSGTLEIKNNA